MVLRKAAADLRTVHTDYRPRVLTVMAGWVVRRLEMVCSQYRMMGR